jgi:AmmeMemoRadiSam system protein B/AmmeMemoRadiSam system protein A
MNPFHKISALCLLILLVISGCTTRSQAPEKIDRQPAVAGSFYPSSKEELTSLLSGYFNLTKRTTMEQPVAVIVPHAGYIFSGLVDATVFSQIDRDREFKHVFIIGSSHTMFFSGASIYTQGDYITPLGTVPVDKLGSELVAKNNILNNNMQPHISEHAIEVELPFLQYWLTRPFKIIPIIIGGESKETCSKLARILEPYFTGENLFVISTDFSHYPSYDDAVRSDHAMASAVVANSIDKFMQTKAQFENGSVANEVTAMCGWTSVLTLLNITNDRSGFTYHDIIYRNSGDSPYGEKDRVVGYVGICVTKEDRKANDSLFTVSRMAEMELLKIARNTITDYIQNGSYPVVDESNISRELLTNAGAFVTLKKHGELRGCIGHFEAEKPLYKTVQAMAVAAATQDPRFIPVTYGEIPDLEIEISVLTPLKKINSIDEIVLGRDGIYIKKGMHGGTFLPQVYDETGWTKEEFLGHCARDKAMIGWDGWKDADIYTYQALIFSEHQFK